MTSAEKLADKAAVYAQLADQEAAYSIRAKGGAETAYAARASAYAGLANYWLTLALAEAAIEDRRG